MTNYNNVPNITTVNAENVDVKIKPNLITVRFETSKEICFLNLRFSDNTQLQNLLGSS